MVLIDGKILEGYKPSYRGGIFDATRIDKEIAEYRARGFDARSQLQAMDQEGLDVAALYPVHRTRHHDARRHGPQIVGGDRPRLQ